MPAPAPVPAERVFIMYDNIGDWFDGDVSEAGEAVASGVLAPGDRVAIFERSYSSSSIYELIKDTSSKTGFSTRLWKQYASGENTSLSEQTIRSVVGDIRALIPAPHYGLAFGSHGMGWIPKSSDIPYSRRAAAPLETPGSPESAHPYSFIWTDRENPLTRFFAGYNQKLDVSEFVSALSGEPGSPWEWDFIILDDCFMASVEALYEMRYLSRYFIASPTEIMSNGFPYNRIVSAIFSDWDDVGRIGREFIDYYTHRSGSYPCGTIAVVDTSQFDALTESIRRLNLREGELTSATQVNKIQFYENITKPAHLFHDLDHYLGTIRATTMPAEYNAFVQQLARTIVYKGHTEFFFSDFGDKHIPVDHYSGLNIFIPWSGTASFIPLYQQTEWYSAVYTQ